MKLTPFALIAALVAVAEARRFGGGGGGGAIQRVPASKNGVQRLHEILSIGNDPREDIRTNRLLNMEGF